MRTNNFLYIDWNFLLRKIVLLGGNGGKTFWLTIRDTSPKTEPGAVERVA